MVTAIIGAVSAVVGGVLKLVGVQTENNTKKAADINNTIANAQAQNLAASKGSDTLIILVVFFVIIIVAFTFLKKKK